MFQTWVPLLAVLTICHGTPDPNWDIGVNDTEERWVSQMFPHRLSHQANRPLPADNETGCNFFVCPHFFYYMYGDDCITVAKSYPVLTSTLSIQATKIPSIWRGDFDAWPHLKTLKIDMNVDLKRIEPGAFQYLRSLTNLSLSDNFNLNVLEPGLFDGLNSLLELRCVKNGFTRLVDISQALQPIYLPRLVLLDLSENHFLDIQESETEEMKGNRIQELRLSMCSISHLRRNALAHFPDLRVLKLDRNNLLVWYIEELVTRLNRTSPKLEWLSLSSNKPLKKPYTLLKVIGDTSIKRLDLRENNFQELSPEFFPYMPNIVTLDLSNIGITSIMPNTFNQVSLPSLKRLLIGHNIFSGPVPGVLVPYISELDLSESTCSSCEASLFNLKPMDFVTMRQLKILNLSKNTIYHLRHRAFDGLRNLNGLLLSNCSIYRIDDYSFHNLESLLHLDLSKNSIKSAITGKLFEGLRELKSLRLDSCGLTTLPDPEVFGSTPKLRYLTLADNSFVDIDPTVFARVPLLEKLDLSNNYLIPWESSLFSSNKALKNVYLSSNQFTSLSVTMIEDFSNLYLVDLKSNPLNCDCNLIKALTARNWADSPINETGAVCFSPKKYYNLNILQFLPVHIRDVDCFGYDVWVLAVVSALTVFILGIFIGCIAYYLRWHIRYWVFLIRQAMRYNYFPGKRKRGAASDKYKYDAFVSYCNEDRSFVVRMVAMLENYEPHFRLCVFERDFNIGDVISDKVMDSISQSRRTILVLTDSFAKSKWCLWETEMAQYRRIFYKGHGTDPDPLIIIKLGEIMDCHMTPTLMYLIKTRVYLQWNPDPKKQKIFWRKLRNALSQDINSNES